MSKSRICTAEFLANVPFFRPLDSAAIGRIAAATTEHDAPRGTIVCHRGDRCTGLHIVVFGGVKLSLYINPGEERVVELVDAGGSFGEAAMFLERPYVTTIEAIADTKLLRVAKDAILAEVEANLDFARIVIANLSERLYANTSDLEIYALSSGIQRVIRYLLTHEPDDQRDSPASVTLPTTKRVIASRLNLTHEHFSRILHNLVKDNLIEVDGREVRIPDLGRLRAFASE